MNIAVPELPRHFKEVSDYIFSAGYYLTAVGGCVRDWLFFDIESLDWDFEIRKIDNAKIDVEELRGLFKKIDEEFQLEVEELPYAIFKFQLKDYEYEISCPRIEKFKENDNSHKNFEAILDSSLSYKESFKRRDLTINAIGVEYIGTQSILIDPYNGYDDGRNKVFRHITLDFTKDPVRLLRLIRFSLKSDFIIEEKTEELMTKFNLTQLSWHYLIKESKKVGLCSLLSTLNEYAQKYHFNLPHSLEFLYSNTHISDEDKTIQDIFVNSLVNFEDKNYKELEFFRLSRDFIKKSKEIDSLLKDFKKKNAMNRLIDHCNENDFEEILNEKSMQELFDCLKQLMKKFLSSCDLVNKIADINKVDLTTFEDKLFKSEINVSQVEIEKITPVNRQNYLIYKKLRKD